MRRRANGRRRSGGRHIPEPASHDTRCSKTGPEAREHRCRRRWRHGWRQPRVEAWCGVWPHSNTVRTVLGALGASCPVPPVRTARRRLVRAACTYSTEAPGRTCQHSPAPVCGHTELAAAVNAACLCDGPSESNAAPRCSSSPCCPTRPKRAAQNSSVRLRRARASCLCAQSLGCKLAAAWPILTFLT